MRVLFMLEREESGHEIQRLAENGKDQPPGNQFWSFYLLKRV